MKEEQTAGLGGGCGASFGGKKEGYSLLDVTGG